jgi:hypothetical protein
MGEVEERKGKVVRRFGSSAGSSILVNTLSLSIFPSIENTSPMSSWTKDVLRV